MIDEIKIPVKLFVSKFPVSMTEDELREVFIPFGEIESLVILKSKDPSRIQGCGFVRFSSISDAARAIRDLNGKHIIDTTIGPLNVEYASGEAERLNLPSTADGTSVKLFIGGVPLSMMDDEVRDYFSQFGQVTECHVLPPKTSNPAIQTKAAFVRFARKADAMAAIENLDKKVSFPGVERPMDVRIAETKTDATRPDDRQPMKHQGTQRAMGMPYSAPQQQRQYMPPPAAAPMRQPRTIGVWTEFYAADGRPYYHNSVTNVTTWDPPVEFRLVGPPPIAPPSFHQQPMHMSAGGGPVSSGPDAKGPIGANLFVFHVPVEWTEPELYSHFAPYGNVLTYRIARERETNRPKGFGFVSYDSPMSAQAAITNLNGMMVSNGKRLKVSLKKGEDGQVSGEPVHYAAPY